MTALTACLTASLLLAAPLGAGPAARGPRQLGEVELRELVRKDGQVSIRVDSGGCTDKDSIRPVVRKKEGNAYEVTFERVREDDCKAFLMDGVVLVYDEAKDLKLTGPHTLTVTNPVVPRAGARTVEPSLAAELRASTRKALVLELEGCQHRLKAAQGGLGPAGNVERFKKDVDELETMIRDFDAKPQAAAPPAAPEQEDPLAALRAGNHGIVAPPRKRTLKVKVEQLVKPGDLLQAEGTTRSGPFFHAAGGELEALKPGGTYEVTVYLVYKREYVALIPCYFVHVAEVK